MSRFPIPAPRDGNREPSSRKAALRRAANAERKDAALFGTTRTKYRGKYQSAPDMAATRLPSGHLVQPETKHRRKLSKFLVGGLEQALAYQPDATPLLIIHEHGGRALVVVRLADFAELVGLVPSKLSQTALDLTGGAT